MQGKLGKAVKICYGHATVMLLLIHKKLSQIAALVMLYISASDGVYTRTMFIAFVYPFLSRAEKDIFICCDVRKSLQ